MAELEVGQVGRPRHRVVHVRTGEELPVLVVLALLEQRLPRFPWASPPCSWPATIIGLMIRPRSSTHVTCTSSTVPVSGSISTSTMWGARREGEVLRIVEGRLVQAGLELLDRVVVRHVCRERDIAERLRPVRPGDGKAPVSRTRCPPPKPREGWAAIRFPLGNHLLRGVVDGRTANRERAGTVGAHPEGDLLRVAVHDLDLVDRDPELVRDDLGERRLVPLAVAVRSGVDGDAPGRVHPHLPGLVEARAAPERPTTADGAIPHASRKVESPNPRSRPRARASARRSSKESAPAISSAMSSVAW